MKNLLFFTEACLCLFATSASAQMAATGHALQIYRQMNHNETRMLMLSSWNGNDSHHMLMGFLWHEDVREGLGISDEQYREIMDAIEHGFVREKPRPINRP